MTRIDITGRLTALEAAGVEGRQYRYNAGLLASVSDLSGKPIARYRYNSLDQRIAKTVGKDTTYTLWQQGNRVAEIDAAGRITSQYLYLTEGTRILPLAKLESAANPDNPRHKDRTLYIHSDQRGAPLAMTDQARQIVWRADLTAWGTARPIGVAATNTASATSFGPATLNLRLPGQYYDAETGLHDNWHRTYDPRTGRYLQPDPLGYPDGPDAYLYAQGDPVNRFDSSGMYAEDVHYYMTYFLALTAGLSANDAWIIATADQTVDNVNPYTDAYPSWAAGGNLDAREKYHFTQDGYDPAPNGPDYRTNRVLNPVNPQLKLLRGYATNASSPCLKAQFYGEYLHAYQDTYGHRDINNEPYGAFWGHLSDGTKPDMTYNTVLTAGWDVNEARTIAMEQAVFAKFRSDWGVTARDSHGNTITFAGLAVFLRDWNQRSNDVTKMDMLNEKLIHLGLPGIPEYDTTGKVGLGCRLKYLRNAHLINAAGKATSVAAAQYPGAILDTKTEGAATCTH